LRSVQWGLWPERVVLVCLGAVLVEVLLTFTFTAAQSLAILTLSRFGLATSLVCTVAGLIGVFQKPRTIGTAICGLGAVAGLVGLVLTALLEVLVRTSEIYFPL
jgi:hypothetical protein